MIVLTNGIDSLSFDTSVELLNYILHYDVLGYYVSKVDAYPDTTLFGLTSNLIDIKVLNRKTVFDCMEYCKSFVASGDRFIAVGPNLNRSTAKHNKPTKYIELSVTGDTLSVETNNEEIHVMPAEVLDRVIDTSIRHLGFGPRPAQAKSAKKNYTKVKTRK
jgi:hypothetical protein